jgi:hypothetical protein
MIESGASKINWKICRLSLESKSKNCKSSAKILELLAGSARKERT